VRERGGNALMPELGYSPTNMYLPPRAVKNEPVVEKESLISKVKDWVNRSVAR